MKVLIISDIHLRAYHRYNKFPEQRLLSFLELAKDVVDKGKEENIDILIITGDIIDKSTLTPKEIHVLFNMFTILASQFTVYSIVGNHDMKLKKGEFEREDSIVTLLEEIDNVHFLHQRIITLNGRTLAFENWVPEFDLSWIKDPVDLYFSHATIDYDNTGFYGMDTSVFKGKFKLGFFGDIHVRREQGNLISVGNTKQESFSDRYQGGGVMLDLDTLDWERFDIDPNHVKYLWLTTTEDLEDEGWVDFEGSDMTYKAFRPKKSASKSLEFELPESTDIESQLNEVMRELNLTKLHKEIKSSTNYQPIDFNFKLESLTINNFRSIKNYHLDFSHDYVVTGPNGSGKSSLLTALFYALIGKKTLKQDVTFGEKVGSFDLKLTYQKQKFEIFRGTDSGGYGLTIDSVVQKYNNKAEFEKDVFDYLPFLDYHESFFFNYWDTELLGKLKVDKRYDLISKYFRLDALSDYNDVGTEKLKVLKKEIKDLRESDLKLEVQTESKLNQLNDLESELKGVPKKEDLIKSQTDYKSGKELSNSLKENKKSLGDLLNLVSESKELSSRSEFNFNEIDSSLKNSPSKELVESDLVKFQEKSELNSRFSKGTEMVSDLQSKLNLDESKLVYLNEKYTLIDPGSERILPSDLLDNMTNLKSELSSFLESSNSNIWKLNSKIETCISTLKRLTSELSSVEKITVCGGCGKPMSNEESIKFLNSEIAKYNSELDLLKSELSELNNSRVNWEGKEKLILESNLEDLLKLKTSIESHNIEVKEKQVELNTISTSIANLKKDISTKKEDLDRYKSILDKLKSDINNLPDITEEENSSNHVLKSNWDRYESLKSIYEKDLTEYERVKNSLLDKSGPLEESISSLESQLESLPKVTEEENLNAALLLAIYNNRDLVKDSYKKELKSLKDLRKIIGAKESEFNDLDSYCQVTSRSGEVLKKTLETLTKTFSNETFRFSTNKAQASGKVVTDMSVEYLVGKNWVKYSALSSGQKTLCDLYFISKIVTGVGVVSFDETLRFLDDENMKLASDIISGVKKQNLLISSHSPNLYIDGVAVLNCKANMLSHTEITMS